MSERREEIRQEDKKQSKRFILLLLASVIFGGLLGAGSGFARMVDGETLDWISYVLIPVVGLVLVWGSLLTALIVFLVIRSQVTQRIAAENQEDDFDSDVDQKLSWVLTVTTICVVLLFTGYGFSVYGINAYQTGFFEGAEGFKSMLLGLLGLIVGLVELSAIQRWAVNTTKERAPEKKGSIFQLNFQRVWLESCDEAEKSKVYESGYRAFRAGNMACLIMWLIAVLGAMVNWVSWGSMVFVGVIWLVMQVAYCKAAMKKGGSGNSLAI